jgi:outer membrane immunogenic protein
MKRLFLGSVALVALSLGTSAAFAAEKRVPAYTPPPPPAPVYTWSGCYVGASAGSSTGSSQHFATAGTTFNDPSLGPFNQIPAGTAITDSFDLSGFIAGGQLGCNWQSGVWVFGIEGDGSATNKEGQQFEGPLATIPGGAGSENFVSQTQERWLVTARGRIGLSGWGWWGDRTLVYATGGAAWAKIDASEWGFLAGPPAATSGRGPIITGHQESKTRTGWTAGGGIEYAVGYGWSVKGEYLYVKFDDYTTFTTGPFAVGTVSPREVKLDDHIWRAGMNYKFW